MQTFNMLMSVFKHTVISIKLVFTDNQFQIIYFNFKPYNLSFLVHLNN